MVALVRGTEQETPYAIELLLKDWYIISKKSLIAIWKESQIWKSFNF